MSGDVPIRKRKDKRRKRDDDESSHGVHITKMGSDDVHLHVQQDHGTGGHWCAKILFFSLLTVLLGLIALIILENRGLADLDTPLSESRFSNYFDGWVDEHRQDDHHDDPIAASIEEHEEHDEPFEEEDDHSEVDAEEEEDEEHEDEEADEEQEDGDDEEETKTVEQIDEEEATQEVDDEEDDIKTQEDEEQEIEDDEEDEEEPTQTVEQEDENENDDDEEEDQEEEAEGATQETEDDIEEEEDNAAEEHDQEEENQEEDDDEVEATSTKYHTSVENDNDEDPFDEDDDDNEDENIEAENERLLLQEQAQADPEEPVVSNEDTADNDEKAEDAAPSWGTSQIKPKETPSSSGGPKTHKLTIDDDDTFKDNADDLDLFEQDLRKANEEMMRENLPAAVKAFSLLCKKFAHKPEAFLGKARALDKLADKQRNNQLLAEAIESYKHFLKFGANIKQDAQFRSAAERCIERLRFLGQQLQAVPIHMQLIDRFSNEPALRNQLAVTYLLTNRC